MCSRFTTTGMRRIGAVVVAVALCHCIRAQELADLMRIDPRLAAGYHFAEFAGGKNIKTDLQAHKVTFTTRAEQKEWSCEGEFVHQEGSQRSRCYLRQTNAPIGLAYECTVVTKDGATAVSLQSRDDGLQYGNGPAALSLLPKWLPDVPPTATLESVRVLHSADGYETVDAVLKSSSTCIRHYAGVLGGHNVSEKELRWSDSKNGSRVIVSVVTDGKVCKLSGKKIPDPTH